MDYDFIVVGAGSAGAVVANRLSADPRHKVLLLEAGPAGHPWTRIPVGYSRLITNPAVNWLYSSEPEPSTNGRRIPVPRGKLLGGSSAINGLAFVRGQAQDFDTWAQMGNQGWAYEDVLPFFKRMESYEEGDERFRGRSGPLKVTNPAPASPLYATVIKAAGEVGIPHNPDYNGARQDGIAMSQATIASGWRMSTARCYLDPVKQRPNLRIETGALAERLLLDGKRCTGVRYSVGGESREGARGPRRRGERRFDQLATAPRTVGHRPAGPAACAGHRGAACPAGRRREPARALCAAHAMDHRPARHHLQRSRPRPRPGAPGAALGAEPRQPPVDGRRAAARLRALARRARGARPAAGLGPDVHRAGAARAADRAAVGHVLLRPSDAAREQGHHPHRLDRSEAAAGDPLQFSCRRRSTAS